MHIAVGDCERIRPGLVAQPANTASSLAYCVAGAWIWWRADARTSPLTIGLAATAVAAGVGSVAYHGPGGAVGKLVHDVGALTMAGATIVTAIVRRPRGHPVLATAAAGTAAGAAAIHAASRTGGPLCCPDCRVQGHALWHLLGALAVVLLAEAVRAPAPRPDPPAPRSGPLEPHDVDDGRSSVGRDERRAT